TQFGPRITAGPELFATSYLSPVVCSPAGGVASWASSAAASAASAEAASGASTVSSTGTSVASASVVTSAAASSSTGASSATAALAGFSALVVVLAFGLAFTGSSTSSICTIDALSPLRKPSLVMRV